MAIRIRPEDVVDTDNCIVTERGKISIIKNKESATSSSSSISVDVKATFEFDRIFGTTSTQSEVRS